MEKACFIDFAKLVATSGELTQRANQTPVVVNNSGLENVCSASEKWCA
jgi:hypothetical protein